MVKVQAFVFALKLQNHMHNVDISSCNLRQLCQRQSLFNNLYKPGMRLIRTKKVEGKKHTQKIYDKPKTPAERLLQSRTIIKKERDYLKTLLKENDLVDLKKEIISLRKQLAQAQANWISSSGIPSLEIQLARPPVLHPHLQITTQNDS